LWGVAIAAALVVGACAAPSDDAAGADSADPTSPAAVSDPVADAGDEPMVGEPVALPGDEAPEPLRLVVVGEPATDPVAASPVDPADVAVLDLLYDGLTRWDDQAGTWVPETAVSVESDRNARIWTFVLGERRFSDGRSIAAEDVVASLERLREESALAADRLDHVASIRAVDATTVRVRLTRPDAAFPALLSHPLFGITPALDGGLDLDGRVGSGPLHMVPGATNALVSVVSHPRPVREVEILPVGDIVAGLAMVRSGGADVIHVPPSYVGPVDTAAASGVVVAYALNAASPRLASVDARRILVDAIDVAAVAGPLPGLEPMGIADVDPRPGDEPDDGRLPASLVVAIVGADSESASDREAAMAGFLASQWGEAGVDVAVDDLSLRGFVALVSAGDHDVIRSGWVDLYPGDRPHWRLVDPGSGANVTGIGDPALMTQLRRAGRSDAPQEEVEKAIVDLGVLLPIGRLQIRLVTAPGADSVVPRSDGSLVLED
jgi:ABC-type transport system substrate-binding protein